MRKNPRGIFTGIMALAFCLMLSGGANAAPIEYCKDMDGDGYGDSTDCVNEEEAGYVLLTGDCNDGVDGAGINPGAMELCGDGIDNNCLNGAEEGCSGGNKQYYYRDADGDNFGNPAIWEYVANPSTGYVPTAGDCDDNQVSGSSINPGMAEICSTTDFTDENCSTTANEGCQNWWQDGDNDGYSTGNNLYDMSAPTGYVLEASLASTTTFDCQDGSASINPAMAEICSTTDLTDENCLGGVNDGCQSWWQDSDHDGYSTGNNLYDMSAPAGYVLEASLASTTALDCKDLNSSINPGMTETCSTSDLTDENCSGTANEDCQNWWQDGDHDGYSTGSILYDISAPAGYVIEATLYSTSALDCNDQAFAIKPGTQEIFGDPIDQNCDGDTGPYFPDPILEALVLGHTGGSYDPVALASLTSINLFSWQPISDLTGMEYLTGLTSLTLAHNSFSDLSPLANLTGLVYLRLESNYNMSDLSPLANLTELTTLILDQNNISDLTPLANLTALNFLSLHYNHRINDLTPLAALTALNFLNLSWNNIHDLTPLAGLTSLTYLGLGYNNISDLTPLADLTNLTVLGLSRNYGNISDLTPLAGLTGLTVLTLDGNSISDLTPLANLTGLTSLSLYNTSISDLTPLANLPVLTELTLNFCSINDLTPLANLTGLNYLFLYANSISDLTPLADLTALTLLYLSNNSISDLTPLANLTLLNYLYLQDNCITDFSPVAHVPNVYGMDQQCL